MSKKPNAFCYLLERSLDLVDVLKQDGLNLLVWTTLAGCSEKYGEIHLETVQIELFKSCASNVATLYFVP